MMKPLINNIKLKDFLLVLLGILLITFIVWNRLIRIRIPKDLPLQLNELTLICYSIIIISLLYLVIRTIKYTIVDLKTREPSVVNNIITFVYSTPLIELDAFIKRLPFVNDKSDYYQYKFITYCIDNFWNYFWIYFFTGIVPKGLVALIFCIDVFYFHKLYYFYLALSLLIISMSSSYIFYSLKLLFDEKCEMMNKRILIQSLEPNVENVTLQIYAQEMMRRRLLIVDNEFKCVITVSPEYIDNIFKVNGYDRKTQKFNHTKALIDFKEIVDSLCDHYTLIYLYEREKIKYDNWVNIIISSLYLIGWSYILFTSLQVSTIDTFQVLNTYIYIEEPFSGLFIYHK